MQKGKSKFIPLLFSLVDIILLLSAFFLAKYLILDKLSMNTLFYSNFNTLFNNSLILGWSLLWIGISLKFDLYEMPRILFVHKIVAENVYALFTFMFLSCGLIFLITDYKFSRSFFALASSFFAAFIIIWRVISLNILNIYRKKGHNYSRILLVGLNKNILSLIDQVYLNPKYGFRIAGLLTDAKVNKELKKYYKGNLSEIISFLEKNEVDEIIVSLPYHQSKLINDLFRYADNNMIRVRVIPEFSEYLSQTFSIDYVQNIPILKLRSEPLKSFTNIALKRIFDILFSLLTVLFLFSWLFPIIALIIKLTSKGPVFFIQQRTGKDGEPFNCFKFRSMTVNSNSDNLQATKNDARITNVGVIMRRTSIDELPQIINVLLNNMSLVGPRPHMLKHTEEYRVLVDKFMVRHFAKPGVTGWAQINGFRGETKLVKDMENRALADIWYIENWTFFLDVKIVFTTAFSMFFKKDENAF
ncbi:undecaprenyl-phosphate galactose phosphotransferase/putative colanic acid biosynthesis UDP-glucose lipid carrier transferase [Polaribacter sp. Hel1_33_96]|uniref:undecaprenyl-phosphate glucose phosphotransferase n=1 Tax=Polaribacter sp. Hel1_33_96 TaxID=1336805 RepID=UPI000C714416|nr:undecaprenyl-phosphate glucose phosphotransferase [Polaribacter sp. Hel1_33_96]PKV65411.1 undecaprenyl-phosphate galactose phosphotransferase/putative colanic acid biosynthesis UDP-glucose lipid carrier transferase [Polaribacter sp. Hel1_33_96]